MTRRRQKTTRKRKLKTLVNRRRRVRRKRRSVRFVEPRHVIVGGHGRFVGGSVASDFRIGDRVHTGGTSPIGKVVSIGHDSVTVQEGLSKRVYTTRDYLPSLRHTEKARR